MVHECFTEVAVAVVVIVAVVVVVVLVLVLVVLSPFFFSRYWYMNIAVAIGDLARVDRVSGLERPESVLRGE